MAGVINCGFARSAVKNSFLKKDGAIEKDTGIRYSRFIATFAGKFEGNFEITKTLYGMKSRDLVNNFNKWKTSEEKRSYLKHFSAENWKKLPQIQKQQHTMRDCRACSVYHFSMQSSFPVKSVHLKSTNPSNVLKDTANKSLKNIKPTITSIKDAAKISYEAVDNQFKQIYNIPFPDAIVKVKGLNLQKRLTPLEQKQKWRQTRHEEKENILKQWQENEVLSFLGSRKSYEQHEQERKNLYFESKQGAEQRTLKRKADESMNIVKKKKHSPDHASLHFDKAGLLDKVERMKEGEEVSLIQCKQININDSMK